MSTEIRVSGDTYEAALEEGLQQLGIPAEAVEISRLEDEHEDTLPGAAPLAGTTLRLRVKDDVLLSKAREHLKRILQLIGVENPQIEVRNRRGGVTLNIVAAQDGPLIIGRNGQNLEALQVLINRMVVHGGRDLVMPFAVDSEGYRERRLTRLEQTAERAARQALRENREVELEPMSASERRIVHTHVKTIRGVHTISRGRDMSGISW